MTRPRTLIRRYWLAALVFLIGVAVVVFVGVRTESLTAVMYTCGINGVIFGIFIGAAMRDPARAGGAGRSPRTDKRR